MLKALNPGSSFAKNKWKIEKIPVDTFNEVTTVYWGYPLHTLNFSNQNTVSTEALRLFNLHQKVQNLNYSICIFVHKIIISIEYLVKRETINATRYCETFEKLKKEIQNKRRKKGVCLLDSVGQNVLSHSYIPLTSCIQIIIHAFSSKSLWVEKVPNEQRSEGESGEVSERAGDNFFQGDIKKLMLLAWIAAMLKNYLHMYKYFLFLK